MPELPEVETIRRTLDPLLSGRDIATAEVHWPRTIVGDIPAFIDAVSGAEITAVGRRAKLILLHLTEGDAITIHLRMTGELRFHAEHQVSPTPPSYLRVRFQFTDLAVLDFFDVRKFGKIAYVTATELQHRTAELGVEPLEPQFTTELLATILATYHRQIKPLLLDQTVIAGLGNIYVDEALFLAGIHPLSRSGSIPRARVAALRGTIVDVLSAAIDNRGTTLRNYRSGLGDEGDNRPRLLVYGKRDGTPCIACGTPLRRIVVGQRGTVYCASCQSLFSD